MNEPNLIVTQAEFARMRSVSRKTVTIWKQQGKIVLTADGRVDVEASDDLLSGRPDSYRGGVTKSSQRMAEAAPAVDELADQTPKPPVLDASIEEIAKQANWTLAEAQRIKENYLALLRKQEFDVEQGKLVEIETIAQQVEREYAVVRERLLTIPGKVAAALVGCDRATIESRLLDEVIEALDELHDPGDPPDRPGEITAPPSRSP